MSQNQDDKWLKIAAIVVVAVIAFTVISYFFFPFLMFTEERDAGKEVVEQEMSAENAIDEYEWFRTQHAEIEAQRNQVENSYDELDRFYEVQGEDPDEWSRTAQERHSRIQQRITGNQNQLENLVADYNARASMDNRAVFQCNLPYQVDDRFAISGPPGSGDADQPVDTDVDGEPVDGEPAEPEQCDGLPEEI